MAGQSIPNIRLDTDSQTVIIEYRDAAGQAISQVPSKEAVRRYALNQDAEKQGSSAAPVGIPANKPGV